MENKRKALGKGLEQLFSNTVIDFDNFEDKIVEENKNNVVEINIAEVRPNPYQPRKTFDTESLNELASSIKEYGIVEPIIVKKSIKGYELVAGERRTKAAKIAGLTKVPAVIKDFNDEEMMEIALIENIQREDLNPIDEATSISNIIKLKGYTQDEFAQKFGKSRSYVTNMLGLLKLPNSVKKLVEEKKLSASHARVISKIEDDDEALALAEKIINEGLSVHEVEAMQSEVKVKNDKVRKNSTFNPKYRMYENALMNALDRKIRVSNKKIELYFDGDKDLEELLTKLNISFEDEE